MADLLLIDDDRGLTDLLADFLRNQGHTVSIANDGLAGIRQTFASKPDLIVLDVTMPQRDGWEVLERIRELSTLPVIMLTARDEEAHILHGFSLGADDYVTKPFSFAQLAARIQAVLNRSSHHPTDHNETELRHGDLTVDLATKRVWRSKEMIHLTPTEFNLLVVMMQRSGEVITPEELVSEVWGDQYANDIGYVRRYIWHLRKKLEPDSENPIYIHNVRGFGYRFRVANVQ
ncbi:MAG: response regulator transcription factor [Chloroflexi bacterium]|nr:response regulator transcription factor [Chloroflexota bacterium]